MVAMEDRYRLVFRGETLDGQHTAVVKKRLRAALGLDDARLIALFAGEPVVVKRDADTKTAARYQAVFKKAGARLRVVPIAGAARSTPSPAAGEDATTLSLRPPGGDLIDAAERPTPHSVQVEIGHLSLAAPGATLGSERPVEQGATPDTSQFTLAAPGSDLGDTTRSASTLEVTIDPEWELADPGVILGVARSMTPVVDLDDIDFDVAPVGVDLGQLKRPPPPRAPDTSHLKLT